MADIKFVREYKMFPASEICFDVLYAKSNRLCFYTEEDLPKTVKKWLEGKEGIVQYDRTLEREETIYKTETMYRVEYDFLVGGKSVHAYLDNNGKGFRRDDAVHIGYQLVAQGNQHIRVTAI